MNTKSKKLEQIKYKLVIHVLVVVTKVTNRENFKMTIIF